MGVVASCMTRLMQGHRSDSNAASNNARDSAVPSTNVVELEEGVAQRANSGSYFGTHFLMGGERFDMVKPDTFLFGDNSDLEMLGNKPVVYPYNVRSVSHTVNVLNSLLNVRRDSVKFVKVENANEPCYKLEFILDADTDCYVQIHFLAKEVVEDDQIRFVSKGNVKPSEKTNFPEGADQVFDEFLFFPNRHSFPLHYDGGSFFPIVIEVRSFPHTERHLPVQVQATMCSIDQSSDHTAMLILKPLKQKLIADGVTYLLQEIYGIENKEFSTRSIDENNAECIICMANPRDTVILPCRHLCICNGCAEALRFKLQNCPICRSPFKALFKFTPAPCESGPNQQSRLTLVEALNGPSSGGNASPQPSKSSQRRSLKSRSRKEKAIKSFSQKQASNDDSNVVEIELHPMNVEPAEESETQLTDADCAESASHTTIVRIDSDAMASPPLRSHSPDSTSALKQA